MQREADTFTIRDLRDVFHSIDFPEYQREPTVWTRDQKQRLLDSILRSFDIASIYLYTKDDGGWECIDGRQRLNAIMSFLGVNQDDEDNEFPIRIHNEVAEDGATDLARFNGKRFADLDEDDQKIILEYPVITVVLSGSREPEEFNLQFLRLNLGTLINAGEKLHAMVGKMRDLLFDSERLGQHAFLAQVRIPTRRFAKELIAAQIMLQVSAKATSGAFTRARHFDLQRYVKRHADREDPRVGEVTDTLDSLSENAAGLGDRLGNRAICVSVVLAAWELDIRNDEGLASRYAEFIGAFLDRLAAQVARMKQYDIDPSYQNLVTFQRHLTQAAVEKPAVTQRHEILMSEFEVWTKTGGLSGDSAGQPDGD